jgi:hypothetical protein
MGRRPAEWGGGGKEKALKNFTLLALFALPRSL